MQPELEDLRRLLEARPDVRVAYVFGSVARGEASASSDVDVAVYTEPPLSFEARCRLIEEVEAAVQRPADVVDLREAPPVLAREIVVEGRAIVCRDELELAELELRVLAIYMDTQHMRDVQHAYLREHLEAWRAAQG